ncbi:MAG: isoprenylcysteine carboxylmethyltransferase family protein [Deltaproteobacteria bacterium]|nr:isoprenylcysteine carboxylmethyltransferase family protein [Deltaproteobacteria bacterium]
MVSVRFFGPPVLVAFLLAGAIPGWIAGCGPRACLLSVTGLAGMAVGLLGALICVTAATRFVRFGETALHPFATPRRLLLQGPYGRARNPFYLGILMMVAGEALVWRSAALGMYGVGLAIVMHLFVVGVEEPRLRRAFGDAYDLYRARVPRWLPVRARSASR